MALVFEQIKNLANKKIKEELEKNKVKELTEREKRHVLFYLKDIESRILELAKDGYQRFVYDCSKLEAHIFHAIAVEFKKQSPGFFVTTQDGCQELVVEWTGKNEV